MVSHGGSAVVGSLAYAAPPAGGVLPVFSMVPSSSGGTVAMTAMAGMPAGPHQVTALPGFGAVPPKLISLCHANTLTYGNCLTPGRLRTREAPMPEPGDRHKCLD